MKQQLLSAPMALILTGVIALAQLQAQTPQTPSDAPPQATQGDHHHGGHRGFHHPNPTREAEFLTKKFNLTADQTTKLETIFTTQEEKMKALHTEAASTDKRSEFQAIHTETEQQLATVLTPDQLAQLKQFHRHGPHGGHGPHGQHSDTPAPAPAGL
jgi:protein CpxP